NSCRSVRRVGHIDRDILRPLRCRGTDGYFSYCFPSDAGWFGTANPGPVFPREAGQGLALVQGIPAGGAEAAGLGRGEQGLDRGPELVGYSGLAIYRILLCYYSTQRGGG